MRRPITWFTLLAMALVLTASVTAQAPDAELELTEEERKAEAAFALADGFYRKGFHDRALEKFLEFVTTYPEHTNAALGLLQAGECHFAQEQYAEAVPVYERVLTEYPNSDELDEAGYRIGMSKYRTSDYAGAIVALEAMLGKTPDTQYKGAAHYWLGECHFNLKQYDEAVKAYDASQKAAPQGQFASWALYSIGMSQLQLGKPAEAMASFQRVTKDYGDSPVAAECGLRVAEALQAEGKTAEAKAGFQAVLQSGQAELIAGGLHGLAWCEFDAENWAAARKAFERLVNEYPDTAHGRAAKRRAADCLYHEAKFADAAEAYEAALGGASEDDKPDILFWQAAALESAGNAEAAKAIYARLANDYPESEAAAKASLRVADSMTEPDDLDDAEKAYKVAAASNDPAVKTQGLLGLAWVAYKRGDNDGALTQYEAIVMAEPSSPAGATAALQGAQVALAAGYGAKGAELAGTFLQHHAGHEEAPRAHYLRGLGLTGADAIPELEQAVAGPKADFTAEALKRLAQLYRDGGDAAKADATLDRLQKDFPESSAGAEAKFDAANELFEANKFAEARPAYEAALAATKDTEIAAFCKLGIGACHFKEGAYEPALTAFEQVVVDHAGSGAVGAAQLQAGICLSRLEKYAEAAEALAKFVADNPESELVSQANTELAWGLLKAGETEKAAGIYEAVVADANTTPERAADAMLRIGEINYEAGKFEEALAAYAGLIEKHPNSDLIDEAHYKSGWCLKSLERDDESLESFRKCLAAGPTLEIAADCHYRLGVALVAAGDTDGAIAELSGFSGEYKDQPMAAYAATTLAELYASKEQWDEAVAAANAAPPTEVAKLKARRALVIGRALNAQGNPGEAVKHLEEAATMSEGAVAADARFELAVAQLAAGNHTDAADNFLNVAILFSEADIAPQALYQAGQAFEKGNANDEAVKAYSSLVNDYTGATEWVEKAKARLQALGQ